jgi:DNA invertase Pin-like site-specific DNA recombinase
LVAARARGRMGGRPRRLDPVKLALAVKLHRERNHTVEEICKMMGISKSTLYNYLDKTESDGCRVA